jgi:hypothetical protein
MRLKITFIGIAAIAILAVGCGGGGGDTTGGGTGASTGESTSASSDGGSSAKPLTKAVFIKKGDEICAKVPLTYEKLTKALEEESKGKKPSEAEVNLKAAVPPLFVAAEEMEELGPPKGEEAKIEAIVDALEAAAKGIEAKPTSELTGPKSPFAEFQKLTGEYGFKACNGL